VRPRLRRLIVAALFALGSTSLQRTAAAFEVPNVGGETLNVDLTNTSVLAYHFDNRNTVPTKPETLVDDYYGEWINRFNLQLNWWRFQAGIRIDGASYFHTTTRIDSRKMANAYATGHDPRAEGDFKPSTFDEAQTGSDYANQLFREMQSRYLRTWYPAKLWVGYSQKNLDVTVGDFYVQLGRGLVFSVRKIDELAIDTTVRGAKVSGQYQQGPMHFSAMAFGGQMNPLRVDEVSGRRLHGESSPMFFLFPKAGDLTTYGYDALGNVDAFVDKPRPSYLADNVVGGRLEGGTDFVVLGVNGSLLGRTTHTADNLRCIAQRPDDPQWASDCASQYPDFTSTDAARMHNTIRTYGASLSFPDLGKHGDLYLEVARQELRDGHISALATDGSPATREKDLSGYALYGALTGHAGPITVTIEGKYYRSFFPLTANVDTNTKGFGAPEFDAVAYSSPPTVEPIYTEALGGSPNVCMTGGRARADYRFDPNTSVYAWVGRYVSSSEITPNNECLTKEELGATDDPRTFTWDTAVGTDLGFEHGHSHARAWVGARTTDRLAPAETGSAGVTAVFYREGYIRYDLVKHIAGPFSIQAQGVHRHRREPASFELPWWEGENYTAFQWAPHIAAIFGYEYSNREGCSPGATNQQMCHYFNGGLQWRSLSSKNALYQLFDTIGVFVGQRRGAVRCVSGVCRLFPPFEGARLEVVSRF
jgi:hypothetical protein